MFSKLLGVRDPHKINIGTLEELELEGFVPSTKKKIITAILCVISLGIFGIILLWKPSLYLRMTHDACHVRNANILLVTDNYDQRFIENVNRSSTSSGSMIWFIHKKRKYCWVSSSSTFIRPKFPSDDTRLSELHPSNNEPLTNFDVMERRQVFGSNKLDIEVHTLWTLFINQARSPLFLSPVVCICCLILKLIFVPKDAVIFGTIVTVIGVIFLYVAALSVLVMETMKNSKMLKERMISESIFNVMRHGQVTTVRTSELVPGDVIYINGSTKIEADFLLIDGSVVVNEGLLTGESIPVTKVAIKYKDDFFCEDLHKNHILHSGTQIVEVKGGSELRAVVLKTGFDTLKGEMIRNILYPKPTMFQLYRDYSILILVFIVIGICAFIWSIVHWSQSELTNWKGVIFRSLDILTFAVPPILPATIVANNLWAQRRLLQNNILCSSSGSISLAGTVDVVCFDKTGTLTDDNLSVESALPVIDVRCSDPVSDISSLAPESLFTAAIASSHSLTLDEDSNPSGNHIDLKMFNSLNWVLVPLSDPSYNYYEMCPMSLVRPGSQELASPYEVGILKIFPFESTEQRTTVVTKRKGGDNFNVFIKGAPEKILNICNPNSIPDDIQKILKTYGSQGLRIIALAHSVLSSNILWKQVDELSRTELEYQPELLGLIFLQNKLKPEAISTMSALKQANLITIMLTGDNIWTAISVSRQCGLVLENETIIVVTAKLKASSSVAAQHLRIQYNTVQNNQVDSDKVFQMRNFVLAIDGDTFNLISLYDRPVYRRLVVKGRIFARMKPHQKVDVIESLQSLGYLVAMCGDGCNDCSAIRAANAGISLSSSVVSAASAFTSSDGGIESVLTVLQEGRSSLTSACASFKYNVTYCFTSLIAILFLFSIYTELTDVQYLVMGLILIAMPCVVLGRSMASSGLKIRKPVKTILHPLHITSIVSFLIMQSLMFTLIWVYTIAQPWFVPFEPQKPLYPIQASFEGTAIVMSLYLSCITGSAIFSHGKPHCKPLYHNRSLMVYLVCGSVFYVICMFCNTEGFTHFMRFLHAPLAGYIWATFLFSVFWQFLAGIWERCFLYAPIGDKLLDWIKIKTNTQCEYEKVEEELSMILAWPKIDGDIEKIKNGTPEEMTSLTEEENQDTHTSEVDDKNIYGKITTRHKFERGDVTYYNERIVHEQSTSSNHTFGK